MLGSMKSVGTVLLLLMSVLYVASSYSDFDFSHIGCKECNLQKNEFFSRDRQPVYQCMGCCFSRAYPTPLREKKVMMNPKNITSEAACCIANNSHWVRVDNLPVRNHTECSCGTCIYHKI